MTRNCKKYTSTLNYRKNRQYEPRPRSSVWHCPPPLVPPTFSRRRRTQFTSDSRFGWVFGSRWLPPALALRKVEVGLDSESHSDTTFWIHHDHATAKNVLARNLSRKDRMDGERCNYSGAYTYTYYRVHIFSFLCPLSLLHISYFYCM
jgi:hypothetical protein